MKATKIFKSMYQIIVGYKKRVNIITILIIMMTLPLSATTFYVSLNGNDNLSGTSLDSAWRHIAYGTQQVQAGDTLLIMSGNYGNEQAEMANSGTTEAAIVIKSEVQQGEVILEGNGDGCGLYLQDKSHIIIEGIKFTNYETGLCVKYQSSYVTVRKCIFVENTNFGLLLYGWIYDPSQSHHHLFIENEFYDYSNIQDYGIALYFSTYVRAANNYFFGQHHQALSFKKLMFNSIAENNTFEGFLYTAIYLGQNEDSQEEGILRCHNLIAQRNVFRPALGYRAKRSIMAANVTRAVIRNNFTEGKEEIDGGWGEGVGIDSSSVNAKIYNNVMRSIGGTTTNPGIRFYDEATGTKIFHNTIVDCAYALGFEEPAYALFKNNIVYNYYCGMIREGTGENCTFEYNDIYPYWEGSGPTDICEIPLFIGPFTPLILTSENPQLIPDFSRAEICHLSENSPCIDAGMCLTNIIGSGTGNIIQVDDSEYFMDGFNITEGDTIRIGNNYSLVIEEIDYDNNIITIAQTISWDNGDGVSIAFCDSAPDIGAYEYDTGVTSIEQEIKNSSNKLQLLSNYPNPFNPAVAGASRSPETTISFYLTAEHAEDAEIIIYNIKGQKVKEFLIISPSPGHTLSVTWDGTDENNQPVNSGIYFYQLKVNGKTEAVKKCLLLK